MKTTGSAIRRARRPHGRLHVGAPLVGLVTFAMLGLPVPVQGQTNVGVPPGSSDAQAAFIESATRAASLYSDRREAMADGFRKLGPDFPGMGEHWVQIGRIVSSEFVGDRPSVLCYIEVDGEPELVGLAYTLPLASDEAPPEEPFGVEVWHDHVGEVSEESLLLNHPSSLSADSDFRLSMLHLWVPLHNPDGMLEQNNWKLPYLRAGLTPPSEPSLAAARGLSLGSAGSEYYEELLHWGVGPNDRDRATVDRILARYVPRVDDWIARAAEGTEAHASSELEEIWSLFWRDLRAELSPEGFEKVRPLESGHH